MHNIVVPNNKSIFDQTRMNMTICVYTYMVRPCAIDQCNWQDDVGKLSHKLRVSKRNLDLFNYMVDIFFRLLQYILVP